MQKKPRLVYQSEGTDDMKIVCGSVENAIASFRADAETFMEQANGRDNGMSNPFPITISFVEMTDEEFDNMEEV